MNDQQYFFVDNFLDTDLVSAIATEKTKLAATEPLPDNCGHFINPDGSSRRRFNSSYSL